MLPELHPDGWRLRTPKGLIGPFPTLTEAIAHRVDLAICPRCGGMFGKHFAWCKGIEQ